MQVKCFQVENKKLQLCGVGMASFSCGPFLYLDRHPQHMGCLFHKTTKNGQVLLSHTCNPIWVAEIKRIVV
jgi:hypothetical protein